MCSPQAANLESLFTTEVLRWRYITVLLLSYVFHYLLSLLCCVFRTVVVDGSVNPIAWVYTLLSYLTNPFRLLNGCLLPFFAFLLLTRIHIHSHDFYLWIPGRRLDYVKRFLTPSNLMKSCLLTAICTYLFWYYASLAQPSYATFYNVCYEGKTCPNHPAWIVLLGGILFGLQFSVLYFGHNYNVVFFSPAVPDFLQSLKMKLSFRFIVASLGHFNNGLWLMLTPPILYIMIGTFSYDCFGALFGSKDGNLDSCWNLYGSLTSLYMWLILGLSSVLLSSVLNAFLVMFSEIVTQNVCFNIGADDIYSSPANPASVWNINNGLQSKCILLKYLSLRHLRDVSTNSTPWGSRYRAMVFTISQPGGHPHNWQGILKPTLDLIKDFTLRLKEANGDKSDVSGDKRSTQSRETNVAQPWRQPAPQEKRLAELKRRAYETFNSVFDIPAIKFFVAPLPDAASRRVVSEAQSVIWAVQGLSNLIAASCNADQYGVVQRDTPDILTHFIQLQKAADQSARGFSTRGTVGRAPVDYFLRKGLRMSIRMALYTVSNAYQEGLRHFRVSEEVRSRLESYLNFREG